LVYVFWLRFLARQANAVGVAWVDGSARGIDTEEATFGRQTPRSQPRRVDRLIGGE
jgi:hypothetical protein